MSITTPQPRALAIAVPAPSPRRPLRELAAFVRQTAPDAGAATGRLGRHAPVLTFLGVGVVAVLLASHGETFAAALERALHANGSLVVAGGLLEVASVAGYVLLLHRVVSGASPRLGWRDS